jgi:ABC-type antimicrobial peptide transport system permease subunit
LQIVGIVEDNLNSGLRKPARSAAFVPYTLWLVNFTQILVRTQVPFSTMIRPILAQVHSVNPEQQTFAGIDDLSTWITEEPEWQNEHLTAWIFGVFAGLALVLAAIGLYSVVSYTVAQRTNEFGIRMALGAPRGHVLRLVYASTMVSVGGGIAAGVALSIGLNAVLARWAEGSTRDPVILLVGTVLLGLVSGIACTLPARNASRVDPMTALRCE